VELESELEMTAGKNKSAQETLAAHNLELRKELEVEKSEQIRLNQVVDRLEDKHEREAEKNEFELEARRIEREGLNEIIVEMRDKLKMTVEENKKTIKTLTAHISKLQRALEALNAWIRKLEEELEKLLDQIEDQDEQELAIRNEELREGIEHIDPANGKKNTDRILELDIKPESTLEKNDKEQDQFLTRNAELEKELESTIDRAKKEEQRLYFQIVEIEKKLESDRDKARNEEKRLSARIAELERDVNKKEHQTKDIAELEKKANTIQSLMDGIDKERKASKLLEAEYTGLKNDFEAYKKENEKLSMENESLLLDKKKLEPLTRRVAELEQEIRSISEKNRTEKKYAIEQAEELHRIIDENQAERNNLDSRIFDLETELESTKKETESLFRERRSQIANRSLPKGGEDLGEMHYSPIRRPRKTDEDIDIISGRASLSFSGRLSPESSITEEETEELRKENITESQNQIIKEYLDPLVCETEKEFGTEIPSNVIQGVCDALLVRFTEGKYHIEWEDFEVILEESCQGYDEDTWFDIQEAFFIAWETEMEDNPDRDRELITKWQIMLEYGKKH